MPTTIYVDISPVKSDGKLGQVEVTCPTNPATTEQQALLADFNKAGLRSATPAGKWLPDREYNYTTLLFNAPAGDDVATIANTIKDIIAKHPEFKLDTESITEAISNTAIESINDMLKAFLGKAVGINANMQNIVYDTKVDVEKNEVSIYAYTTVEANDNDTKNLDDVITAITAELKKRSDVDSVTKSSKDGTFKVIVKLLDTDKLLSDRIGESTRVVIDKLCEAEEASTEEDDPLPAEGLVDDTSLEIWPATLPDESLAVIIANSAASEDGDFAEACGKIREADLMHPEEDDDATLSDNFDMDNCVVIRAPEAITPEGMFDWADTIGKTFEAVGFDVQLNMTADTDPSEFEKVEPEADTATDKPVTEADDQDYAGFELPNAKDVDKSTAELKQTYDKMFADFKAGKLTKSAWAAYCTDTLTKLMQDNSEVFKRLKTV